MDPEGGQGSGPHPTSPKNHKNIVFFSNTGPDPMKITKLPSQHSMLGCHQHASELPLKWRFAGGPHWPAFSGILILSSTKFFFKNPSELDPSDKTFWIHPLWGNSHFDLCHPMKETLVLHVHPGMDLMFDLAALPLLVNAFTF